MSIDADNDALHRLLTSAELAQADRLIRDKVLMQTVFLDPRLAVQYLRELTELQYAYVVGNWFRHFSILDLIRLDQLYRASIEKHAAAVREAWADATQQIRQIAATAGKKPKPPRHNPKLDAYVKNQPGTPGAIRTRLELMEDNEIMEAIGQTKVPGLTTIKEAKKRPLTELTTSNGSKKKLKDARKRSG